MKLVEWADRRRAQGHFVSFGRASLGRHRLAIMVTIAALLTLGLAACASMETPDSANFNSSAPLPPPRDPTVDEKTSLEHRQMIALFDGEYKYSSAENYLNGILSKLSDAAGGVAGTYKATILNSPVVNAFALPPGNLYVTRGLLALATDASEVAAVMAHEIAHILANHASQREEEQKRAAVISQVASVIQSKQKSQEVEALAQRTIASFSRQQELEADQIGIRLSAKAGYDPYGAARFLGALDRSAALRGFLLSQYTSAGKPDITATHPSTPDRVAEAVKAARQIGAPGYGASGRSSYLAAIDGMIFGDDPGEGAIRGREFVHGRLGFAFLAPDGISLENASHAVLGVKAGNTEALRLDSANVPQTASLTAYMASGWIDGLDVNSIEKADVNGMPAALAIARAGEWSFFAAAIRFTPVRVYRLIFAARSLTEEAKARYRESINSFHRISPDELKSIKPLRLAIHAAQPDDTADILASRMAVPERGLDYFLLINALKRGESLQPGERYKIIIE